MRASARRTSFGKDRVRRPLAPWMARMKSALAVVPSQTVAIGRLVDLLLLSRTGADVERHHRIVGAFVRHPRAVPACRGVVFHSLRPFRRNVGKYTVVRGTTRQWYERDGEHTDAQRHLLSCPPARVTTSPYLFYVAKELFKATMLQPKVKAWLYMPPARSCRPYRRQRGGFRPWRRQVAKAFPTRKVG